MSGETPTPRENQTYLLVPGESPPPPLPDSLADLLLRVLQEFVGPVQDIPAAVQHLPSLLRNRPARLRCPCTFLMDVTPATQCATCTALSMSV